MMGVTSYSEFDNLRNTVKRWQTVSDRPFIRYVIGAMQEVSKRYTEISLKTPQRIEKTSI